VRRVPFSCFAPPDTLSAVPRGSCPVFMFCAPGLVFGGSGGVGSRFHVLRSHARFRRYRESRVSFSCFALPDFFLAVPRASGLVFMFCAPVLVFGRTEGVGSRFHVLRARTRYRRYRGRLVLLSSFALPNSFSAVPRASCPVFMFCAPRLVFGGTKSVWSSFHVLRSETHFRRYRRVPFSCFARLDSFSAVPTASGPVFMFCVPDPFSAVPRASVPVFMFCAPGLIFGGTKCVGALFHVLRYRTRFRRYRGRRFPFSCFALPESFSGVLSVSGPIFMFCAHIFVIGGTEGVGSRFHVLRA
jgi:hypothetical protein